MKKEYSKQLETLEDQFIELKKSYENLSEKPEPEWMREFRESMKEFRKYANATNMKKQMKELGQKIGKEIQKKAS